MDIGDLRARIEQEALALARARCECAKAFSIGAVDIDPKLLAVWITTETDAQRDALAADPALKAALVAVLHAVGYPEAAIPEVIFTYESQETVAREFGGDWWACIK